MNDPSDKAEIDRFVARFGPDALVSYAELCASQPERLARTGTELRLAHKASKRDLTWSNGDLRDMDERYVLNSSVAQPFFHPERHIVLNTEALAPDETARRIAARFGLAAVTS